MALPAESPEYDAAGLAEGYAADAAASAVEAAASAALVDSYDGAVPILENAALESNNLDVTVPSWRDYDFIQVVVRDSNATEQIDRPAPQIPTAGLDTYGESRVPFNNNDEFTHREYRRKRRYPGQHHGLVRPSGLRAMSLRSTAFAPVLRLVAAVVVEADSAKRKLMHGWPLGVLDPAETGNTDAWGVSPRAAPER